MPGKVVPGFEIKIYRPDGLGDLDWQQEPCSTGSDSGLDCSTQAGWLELRKDGCVPTALIIQESPFHAGEGVPPTGLHWLTGFPLKNIRNLVGELDAIAQSEVQVNLRDLKHVLMLAQDLHHTEIDFPIAVAWRARVVGQQGRPALRAGPRWNSEKTERSQPPPEPATP